MFLIKSVAADGMIINSFFFLFVHWCTWLDVLNWNVNKMHEPICLMYSVLSLAREDKYKSILKA